MIVGRSKELWTHILMDEPNRKKKETKLENQMVSINTLSFWLNWPNNGIGIEIEIERMRECIQRFIFIFWRHFSGSVHSNSLRNSFWLENDNGAYRRVFTMWTFYQWSSDCWLSFRHSNWDEVFFFMIIEFSPFKIFNRWLSSVESFSNRWLILTAFKGRESSLFN